MLKQNEQGHFHIFQYIFFQKRSNISASKDLLHCKNRSGYSCRFFLWKSSHSFWKYFPYLCNRLYFQVTVKLVFFSGNDVFICINVFIWLNTFSQYQAILITDVAMIKLYMFENRFINSSTVSFSWFSQQSEYLNFSESNIQYKIYISCIY